MNKPFVKYVIQNFIYALMFMLTNYSIPYTLYVALKALESPHKHLFSLIDKPP